MNNEPTAVLLIEDDPDHAELIRRSFDGNRNDMRLAIAGSLAQARASLALGSHSVIVCDYQLPDGTALEMLRHCTGAGDAAPPFVLLTSHGDETIAVEAMKAGAADYIVKSERSLASLPEVCRALIGGYRHRLEKERLERQLIRQLQANESELLESRRQLQKSEQLLNRAQEMAKVGCWELDAAANRLYWSDEVYRIFGLQPQLSAASYRAFLEAVHPDDRALVSDAFFSSLADGADACEL